jgi:hypothetical protein
MLDDEHDDDAEDDRDDVQLKAQRQQLLQCMSLTPDVRAFDADSFLAKRQRIRRSSPSQQQHGSDSSSNSSNDNSFSGATAGSNQYDNNNSSSNSSNSSSNSYNTTSMTDDLGYYNNNHGGSNNSSRSSSGEVQQQQQPLSSSMTRCPSTPMKSPSGSRLFSIHGAQAALGLGLSQSLNSSYNSNQDGLLLGRSLNMSGSDSEQQQHHHHHHATIIASDDDEQQPSNTIAGAAAAAASSSASAYVYEDEEFENLGEVGRGDFGIVLKVRSLRDGQLYAVKKSQRQFRGMNDRMHALKEVENFTLLSRKSRADEEDNSSSNYCVRYFNAWEDRGHLFIQTELFEHGTLKHYLECRDGPCPEPLVWQLFIDLVLGLEHIHNNDLVHLDLKPENVFVTARGTLKIGDFGIAVQPSQWQDSFLEGDPTYLAPELLDSGLGLVNKPADVFSLGLILFEMAADASLPRRGQAWQDLRHEHTMTSCCVKVL